MNLTTSIFGMIVLFFLWRGYQKGFAGSLTRLFGWLIAYPAAALFTKPLSNMISKHSMLDGLIVYFIAGGSIFMLVSFIAAQLFRLFTRSDKVKHSTRSRIGGAAIGVLVGGFVGLLVGYAILLVQKPAAVANADVQPAIVNPVSTPTKSAVIDAYTPPKQAYARPAPTLIESGAKKLAGALVSTAADVVLDDPATTQITRSFAENPQETMIHITEIANNGEITAVFADPEVQAALNSGDINQLLVNEKFMDMVSSEHMQGLLENIRQENTGKTSPQMTAETMMLMWQRMDAMKQDPRVESILADPEFRDQVMSSDKISLLMNPKMKELTEILLSKPDNAALNSSSNTEKSSENTILTDDIKALQESLAKETGGTFNKKPEIESETPIYRWVDENGRVHFSDHEKGSEPP